MSGTAGLVSLAGGGGKKGRAFMMPQDDITEALDEKPLGSGSGG